MKRVKWLEWGVMVAALTAGWAFIILMVLIAEHQETPEDIRTAAVIVCGSVAFGAFGLARVLGRNDDKDVEVVDSCGGVGDDDRIGGDAG